MRYWPSKFEVFFLNHIPNIFFVSTANKCNQYLCDGCVYIVFNMGSWLQRCPPHTSGGTGWALVTSCWKMRATTTVCFPPWWNGCSGEGTNLAAITCPKLKRQWDLGRYGTGDFLPYFTCFWLASWTRLGKWKKIGTCPNCHELVSSRPNLESWELDWGNRVTIPKLPQIYPDISGEWITIIFPDVLHTTHLYAMFF